MPHKKKKQITQRDIEQAAKRQEQKEAGALDGRFRQRVVPSKKTFQRKTKHSQTEE